jgi:hypothetical protein
LPMPFTSTARLAQCRTPAGVPPTCATTRSSRRGQWQRPAAMRPAPAAERTTRNSRRRDRRAPGAPPLRQVHLGAADGDTDRPRVRVQGVAADALVSQGLRPMEARQRGAAMLHSIERLPWSHQPCRPSPPRRPAASPAAASPAPRGAAAHRTSQQTSRRPARATATAAALHEQPPPTQTDIGAASSGRDRRD